VTDRLVTTAVAPAPEQRRASTLVQTLLRSEWPWMLYLAFVVLLVVFSFASPWFLSIDNFLNIGRQTTLVSIVAIGMTFVIIAGQIDLSVASTLALSGMAAALAMSHLANFWFVGALAGLGTGGTLMGNGRRLKETFGDAVKIVAAEPMQGEPVQGLRSLEDGFIPPIIDLSLLDRKIFVTNHDAIVWTRKLLDEERLFAGVSSGAIARVAVRIAGELDEGNVVFIVADDGWKYLSSGIYTLPIEEIENLDSTVWW